MYFMVCFWVYEVRFLFSPAFVPTHSDEYTTSSASTLPALLLRYAILQIHELVCYRLFFIQDNSLCRDRM